MNKHEYALNLLRSQINLTPAQQLEAIELSVALQRKRTKATLRTLGVGALCLGTFALAVSAPEYALAAIVMGVVSSLAWIWGNGSDEVNPVARPALRTEPETRADAAMLREIDERLANLEAILSYEEKIAARRHDAENSRATQRLGMD